MVTGTLALAHPGGTESYCLTVARALDRLGHDVTLFADELGPLADHVADRGVDVARALSQLPEVCDAVLANAAITVGLLAERYPDTRVTAENYPALEPDNFAGLATGRPVDRRALAADLHRYDPDMGWINREIAVTHHSARSHALALVEVLRGPSRPRPDSIPGPAATARAVRAAWRMQRRAAGSAQEASALRAQLGELTARLDAAQDTVRTTRDELDAAQARALAADRELDARRELLDTRRARVGIALGRCLDRLRGKP